MKIKNHKYAILIVSLVFSLSCSHDMLDEIDTDPNNPTAVEVNFILPIAQLNFVHDMLGGGTARWISSYVEHHCNVHLNPYWPERGTGLFNQAYRVLRDTKEIIEKGSEENKWTHVGIAQVIHAIALATLTDVFGDVPYSEALQGSEFRNPVYDSQEDIYNELFLILYDAILNLSKEAVTNPGNTDMLLQGNKDMWIKVAWGLKARYHNRLSNINANSSASNALDALKNSFAAPGEVLSFDNYTDGGSNHVNLLAFHHIVSRDVSASLTMVNVLNSFNDPGFEDPRAERWFTKINGEIIGAPNGQNLTDVAQVLYSPVSYQNVLFRNAPVIVLTYDELKFIEAEANFRLENFPEANSAYQEAVKAACARTGLTNDEINSYISQGNVFTEDENLTLEMIIKQKFISFFISQSIEAYNDYRRTGIPVLHNTIENLGFQTVDGVPLRMPYPDTELARNSNAPTNINNVTIYTIPVWWAKK